MNIILIFLIALLAIVIFLFFLVTLKEIIIRREIKKKKEIEESEIYKEKLKEIFQKNKDKKKIIEEIDSLAKEFFKKFQIIEVKDDYYLLGEMFKEANNPEGQRFCELMLKAYYAPERIVSRNLKEIKEKFEKIITDNTERIIQKHKEEENKILMKIIYKTQSKEYNNL
ncbi:MAG: hypothetical protein QW273_01870 [Candidatus Pacearchaeota archaeon]